MFDLVNVKRVEDKKYVVKFNRSAVMKLAWAIKREKACDLSTALKLAWKGARCARKEAIGCATYINDDVTLSVNFWAKYGKIRGYFNGCKRNPLDKYSKSFDCHTFVNLAA